LRFFTRNLIGVHELGKFGAFASAKSEEKIRKHSKIHKSEEINGKDSFAKRAKTQIECPGGVAQRTWPPPKDQKTPVRIPPGCKVFRKNKAMLLCIIGT
jgi:hypothetical protein